MPWRSSQGAAESDRATLTSLRALTPTGFLPLTPPEASVATDCVRSFLLGPVQMRPEPLAANTPCFLVCFFLPGFPFPLSKGGDRCSLLCELNNADLAWDKRPYLSLSQRPWPKAEHSVEHSGKGLAHPSLPQCQGVSFPPSSCWQTFSKSEALSWELTYKVVTFDNTQISGTQSQCQGKLTSAS